MSEKDMIKILAIAKLYESATERIFNTFDSGRETKIFYEVITKYGYWSDIHDQMVERFVQDVYDEHEGKKLNLI